MLDTKKGPAPHQETGHHKNTSSVSRPRFSTYWPGEPLYFAPPPETLTESAQRTALEYFDLGVAKGRLLGHTEGFAAGYAQAEADMAELQRQAVEYNQESAKTPPYDRLCELRGEPHRAEAHRALLRKREVLPWLAQ